MFLNATPSPFRSVLFTSPAPHLRFALSSARINKARRTNSKVIGIATRKANGISWFGSNRAAYLFSCSHAGGEGPAKNANERLIFLLGLAMLEVLDKLACRNEHVAKSVSFTWAKGFDVHKTCTQACLQHDTIDFACLYLHKAMNRLTALFIKHVGRVIDGSEEIITSVGFEIQKSQALSIQPKIPEISVGTSNGKDHFGLVRP